MLQSDSDQYNNELDFNDITKSLGKAAVAEFPYNCIGYLVGHHSKVYKRMCRGTGFLIGPNLVLTVAHNIYNRGEKSQNVDFLFYPGVSGEIGGRDAYKVVATRFPEMYKTCGGSETIKYDYALLKLDRKVPRQRYIELGLEYAQVKEEIATFGYRDCDDNVAIQKGLWKAKAHQTDLPTIRHQLTTLEGNSGSPLLVKRNGECLAIAIHKGGKKGESYNGARAFTKDLLMDILAWEKELASEIRFCLMTENPRIAIAVQSDSWLANMNLKINLLISDLHKPVGSESSILFETTHSQIFQNKDKRPSSIQSSPTKTMVSKVEYKPSSSIQFFLLGTQSIAKSSKLVQQKNIEIKHHNLRSIADDLEEKLNISMYEKQQITSLTLKATYCFPNEACNNNDMKSYISINSGYDQRYQECNPDTMKSQVWIKQEYIQLYADTYLFIKKGYFLFDAVVIISLQKKRIALCVKQLISLSSFTFYIKFRLMDHESFRQLRDVLNSLPELNRVKIVVDPSYKQSEVKNNWAQGWAKSKNPNKTVQYKSWE